MFLGAHELGSRVRAKIAWTPAVGETVTDSTVTFVHEDGTTLGPYTGVPDTGDVWYYDLTLPKSGKWWVRWKTSPLGGVTDDSVYVDGAAA